MDAVEERVDAPAYAPSPKNPRPRKVVVANITPTETDFTLLTLLSPDKEKNDLRSKYTSPIDLPPAD
jgi:hypothetical protein